MSSRVTRQVRALSRRNGNTTRRRMRPMIRAITNGLVRFSGILFPERLRTKAVNTFLVYNTFTSVYNQSTYMTVNNASTGIAGNNTSGLSWLLSGSQTNGSSYAPYNTAIVREVDISCLANVTQTASNTSGCTMVMFPLAPGITTTSVIVQSACEMFGATRPVMLPALATTSATQARVARHYNLASLFGVDEQIYLNNPDQYGFTYAANNGTYMVVALMFGTNDQVVDGTYVVRATVKVIFDIEFCQRNMLNVGAPHA